MVAVFGNKGSSWGWDVELGVHGPSANSMEGRCPVMFFGIGRLFDSSGNKK